MAFIMRNAAGKLLMVAVCGIGGAPSCGSHQLRREYPLPPLTQTPIRHLHCKAIALGGGEEVEEEGVVPAGAFDLASGRALVAVGAQHVEGEAADRKSVV